MSDTPPQPVDRTDFHFWPLLPLGILVALALVVKLVEYYTTFTFNLPIVAFCLASFFGLVMSSFSIDLTQDMRWRNLWPVYAFCVPIALVTMVGAAFIPFTAPEPA